LVYVEVEDADAVVARAAESGGVVLAEPFDVPGIGRVALLAGRSGERFAVMRMPAAG
jgi:predicted enzyme related to lactoylglutathione lyase